MCTFHCFWFHFCTQYDLPKSELNSRTLWLSVWDWNKFGRNQFLGEIRIPLSSFDLNVMRSQWYQLQDQVSYQHVIIFIAMWEATVEVG